MYARKDDHVFDCARKAADRAGFEPVSVHGCETALEEFQSRFHDLVLIDSRHAKFNADTLCRSVSNYWIIFTLSTYAIIVC